MVVDQQFLRFFGEGWPVGGAVFLDDADFAAQDATHGVNLVNGQLLGLDGTAFRNGHGAGRRVQLAYHHLGVGHGKLGRVDLGGGELLGHGYAGQTDHGHGAHGLQKAAALQVGGSRRVKQGRIGLVFHGALLKRRVGNQEHLREVLGDTASPRP